METDQARYTGMCMSMSHDYRQCTCINVHDQAIAGHSIIGKCTTRSSVLKDNYSFY